MVTNFQIDNSLRNRHCDDTIKKFNKGILVMGTVSVGISILLNMPSKMWFGQSVVIETEM